MSVIEFKQYIESPFLVKFSLEPLLIEMDKECNINKDYAAIYSQLLAEARQNAEISEGIELSFLYENKELIDRILNPLFPSFLSHNEIKAITVPFHNFVYHPTKRLQNILNDAGENFSLKFSGLNDDQFYLISCCAIIHFYYGRLFKTGFPLSYDIPNKEGIMNHYRLLNNTDFIDITPSEKAINLTDEDIDMLLDHSGDIELWKKYFPPQSWIMKGFGIVNLYDATTEIAISNLKSKLIEQPNNTLNLKKDINNIFRSIYQIADLEVGYTSFNFKKNIFSEIPINNVFKSIILDDIQEKHNTEKFYEEYFSSLLDQQKYFTISDIPTYVKKHPNSQIAQHFHNKGVQSVIFATIFQDTKQRGILELTSKQKKLNSINANKLDIIISYLEDTIERVHTSIENEIGAIIQQEYTSIHPSVYWKFYEEVIKHINIASKKESNLTYESIGFEELTPLYGQSDIKSSSLNRNNAILLDLKYQLELIKKLLENLRINSIEGFDNLFEHLKEKQNELESGLKANTEIDIQNFITNQVNPILDRLKLENLDFNLKITAYYSQIDSKSIILYNNRNRFDESISIINKEISHILDKRQEEQQKVFPFYFERFKTDGVEHNIYIGSSIAPWLTYNKIYLQNLRIWQLRVLIETEIHFHHLKETLPHPLEITSLILAYTTPMSIRFRMDEKRFDVDGSYNARYEIIKKRIDKAHIKNSNERIVQVGKICIVYTNSIEKNEYLQFITMLQKEGQLHEEIEILDVENLPGINGLKAIRVSVNIDYKDFLYPFYNPIK